MAKYKIDPALEEQLKKRGMNNTLSNLQDSTKKTSTSSNFLSSLGDTLKNVGSGISDFLGTSVLGQAYGGAMATGYVDKLQREVTRTNLDLNTALMRQVKDPTIPKERKQKIVEMYNGINPDITSQIPELQITDKQIWGNSAKLAANIALMGKSPLALEAKAVGGQGVGYIAPTMAKELSAFANESSALTSAARVAKFGKIGQAANLLEKFGPQVAYDFLLGSAYGVADATGKNKSIDEVKNEGLMGGAINAGAPIVGGLVLRGLGQGLKYTGKGIAGVTNNLRNKAEQYALGTTVEQRIAESKNLSDELLSIYQPVKTKGQELATKFVNAVDYLKELPQKLLDAGKPLDKYSRQSYLEYRLGSDAARAKATDAKYTIANDIFHKDPEIFKQQKAKLSLLDQIDRARLGDVTTLDGGDVNLLEDRLAKLEVQHNDLGISEQVQKAVDDFNEFNTKLLQEKVDAGLISKETLDKLVETHPNYIPHSTVARTLDESTPGFSTQTRNPGKSTIVSSTGGSERALEDPIQTIFNRLDNHYQAVSNSKLTDALIKDDTAGLFKVAETEANHVARKKLAEEYHGLVIDLKKKFREFSTNNKFGKKVTAKFNDIQESIKGVSSDLEQELSAYLSGVKIKEIKPTMEVSGFKTPGAKYSRLIDTVNELNTSGRSRKEIEEALMKDNEFFRLYETGQLEAEGFNTVDNFIEGSLSGKTTIKQGEKVVKRNAKKSIITSLEKKITDLQDTMESVGIKKETMDEYISIIKNQIESIKNKKLDIKTKFKELKNTEDLSTLSLKEQGLLPINRWVNGFKETYFVPEEVAVAVKNLNREPLTGFVKHWGAINNVFKKLTTGYNLPFAVNNLAKDRQTAYVTADALITKFLKDAKLPASTRTKIGLDSKGLVDLYRRTGGSGADIYADSGFKNATKTFDEMRKSGFAKVVDSSYRPDQWIASINSELEKSTRLDVFKKALERGVPVQEATLIARDATVDFSKMGTQMKNLNQIFPFLNARVQGASNMLKVAAKSPEVFARKMYYTSVIPTVLLDQYNSQFESNKNINSNISDNYWYVITGEENAIDKDGRSIKVPNVVALKKGEMQQVGSIAIKEFLNRMRNENPKSAQEISFKLLGSISPIGTGGYNPSSWWTAPIAATGPVAKSMVGLGTNIDPYTGLSIVPDSKLKNSPALQYSDNNKQLTKQIGETLGVSPAKIEFIIGSFGAVPKQSLQAADITQGLAKGEGVRSKALTDSGFSSAANLPWLDNFLKQGAYIGSEDYKSNLKKEGDIQTKEADINLKNKQQADLLVNQAYKIENLDERKRWLKEQESNYPESVISRAKTEYRARNAEGYLRPGMDTAVISQFVYNELQSMSKSNFTSEQKIEYLDNLFKKGIITPAAKKEIQGLNQYGIYIDDIENAKTDTERFNNILSSVSSMKDNKIDSKYITLFLNKVWNDGFITPETKPILVERIKELFAK